MKEPEDNNVSKVRFYCYGVKIEFDPQEISGEELEALMQAIISSLDAVKAVHHSEQEKP